MLNTHALERLAWGKTHYFDADTRRFFGSRFGDMRGYAEGFDGRPRLVTMVESVQPPHDSRKFRPVIFDVEAGRVLNVAHDGSILVHAFGPEDTQLTPYEAHRRMNLARDIAHSLAAFFRALGGAS